MERRKRGGRDVGRGEDCYEAERFGFLGVGGGEGEGGGLGLEDCYGVRVVGGDCDFPTSDGGEQALEGVGVVVGRYDFEGEFVTGRGGRCGGALLPPFAEGEAEGGGGVAREELGEAGGGVGGGEEGGGCEGRVAGPAGEGFAEALGGAALGGFGEEMEAEALAGGSVGLVESVELEAGEG